MLCVEKFKKKQPSAEERAKTSLLKVTSAGKIISVNFVLKELMRASPFKGSF